jgi:hypothetical protein
MVTAEYKIKISHCINEAINTEIELSAEFDKQHNINSYNYSIQWQKS